jgi:hypothetical protein
MVGIHHHDGSQAVPDPSQNSGYSPPAEGTEKETGKNPCQDKPEEDKIIIPQGKEEIFYHLIGRENPVAILPDQWYPQALIGHHQGDVPRSERFSDEYIDRPFQIGGIGQVNMPAMGYGIRADDIGIAGGEPDIIRWDQEDRVEGPAKKDNIAVGKDDEYDYKDCREKNFRYFKHFHSIYRHYKPSLTT